jgi:hypothetical protein
MIGTLNDDDNIPWFLFELFQFCYSFEYTSLSFLTMETLNTINNKH